MVGFVLVMMTLVFGTWVLMPVVRGTRARWEISEEDTPLGRLALRKEVLLGNLQDLDFEFAMGKLGEEDYRSLRDSLKQQTVRIMEQMDVVSASESSMGSRSTVAAATATATLTCEGCGGSLPPQSRFCPNCGSKVGA